MCFVINSTFVIGASSFPITFGANLLATRLHADRVDCCDSDRRDLFAHGDLAVAHSEARQCRAGEVGYGPSRCLHRHRAFAAEDAGVRELGRFPEDRLLREVEDPDDVVLGMFAEADPRAVDGDEPLHDRRLEGAAGRRPQAFQQAGFDLQQNLSVDIRPNEIIVRLPHAQILGVEQEQVDVLAFENGLWNRISGQDLQAELSSLPQLAWKKATATGLPAEAERSLQRQLEERIHPPQPLHLIFGNGEKHEP